MFGLSWKLTAWAAIASLVVGFTSGAVVTAKFYKSAIYEARIKQLESDLAKRNEAANADAEQAQKDRAELDQLKDANRELQDKISDGDCLTGDDTRWLHDQFFKRK